MQNIQAEPCLVELYSKIYRFDKDQGLGMTDIIKSSTCDEQTNKKITQLITNGDNDLYISKIEKAIADQEVHLTPRKISFALVSELLRTQLTANSNLYFLDIHSLNNTHALSISENETLKANCEACTTLGEKNIKIEISNPINNTLKANWITSKIMAKIKVFKAKKTLSFQQKNLTADDFYSDEIFTSMPDNVLGSLDNIAFFKPNKTILQGSVIGNMDVQPVNLVNYGVPVKVILKNQNIGLTKTMLPTRSAQFGESVELHVGGVGENKTISGKVIDFNQVVIEI